MPDLAICDIVDIALVDPTYKILPVIFYERFGWFATFKKGVFKNSVEKIIIDASTVKFIFNMKNFIYYATDILMINGSVYYDAGQSGASVGFIKNDISEIEFDGKTLINHETGTLDFQDMDYIYENRGTNITQIFSVERKKWYTDPEYINKLLHTIRRNLPADKFIVEYREDDEYPIPVGPFGRPTKYFKITRIV